MTLPVARLGDLFTCGDMSAAGSGDVFINNLPATRLGDATTGHPLPCGFQPPTINQAGSGTVFVNNLPLCRLGDPLVPHGTCGGPPHPGVFAVGSGDVFAG